jgi:hypothetical protein
MGSETKGGSGRSRWAQSAGWMAGIGIALVEMQIGMDYVLSSLVEHVRAIAGWLPAIGAVAAHLCGG